MEAFAKNIIFFRPSRIVGGCEYLFIRLAKHIAENYGYSVKYIDYKDGFARKQLEHSRISFIDYVENERINLNSSGYLITNLGSIYSLYKSVNVPDSIKLFLWNVYVYDCLLPMPFLGYFISRFNPKLREVKKFINFLYKSDINKVKQTINTLSENNAIVYMDQPNFETTQFCLNLTEESPKLLQIPAMDSEVKSKTGPADSETINIGWLGRLANFKVYSLLNVIENADKYAQENNKKVRLHIIGKGPRAELIEAYSPKKNLELVFLGTMIGEELDSYLANKIDVLFAMGTSCLEGARLRIPSVVIDFSYGPFPSTYRYNWLYETEGFGLGRDIQEMAGPNKHSFDEIIQTSYNNKHTVGEQCYRYFKKNHSIDSVAQKLVDYLTHTSMTMTDLSKTGIFKFYDRWYSLSFIKRLSFVKSAFRFIFRLAMYINLRMTTK